MPRPLKQFHEKLWPRVDATGGPDACWPWTGSVGKNGYATMSHGKKQNIGVHRVSFYIANGFWPPVVMHTCDNPRCCNPSHLVGGTQKENIADMISKGRQSKNLNHKNRLSGSRNKQSKLAEHEALAIYQSQESSRKLAAQYGVSRRCIMFIKNGTTWSHVTQA